MVYTFLQQVNNKDLSKELYKKYSSVSLLFCLIFGWFYTFTINISDILYHISKIFTFC
jgi:hypothetical protein